MGAWLPGFLASPFMDSASDLVRTRGGGLAVWFQGFARLAAQCACPRWRCSGRTRAVGPTFPRLGAYQCVGSGLAVALTFLPFRGVPYPKGMLEEKCAVVWGSRAPSGSWSRCGGVGGSRARVVACAVLYSNLGAPRA